MTFIACFPAFSAPPLSSPGRYEFNFFPLQLIPFSGYVDAHTFHHTKNTGNYSLYWAFWDDIMGTNADYKAYVKAQILAENGSDAAAAAAESYHCE